MNIINREVGQQGKGYRLQRLRAIKLLLDKMKTSDKALIYSATEYLDDVYMKTINNNEVEQLAEGDKDYDSVKSFTFMSEEVKNSIISLLDCWFQYKKSEGLIFCFYTNIKIGKEKHTKFLKKLGVELPDKEIIQLLIDKKYNHPNLLPTIKTVITNEYEKQYEDIDGNGFLSFIQQMNDDLWIEFLDKIDWKFEQEDDKELEKSIIEDIRNQTFYTLDLDGKEKYILARLLDEFEKRQIVTDPIGRLISHNEVKAIFLEVATNQSKRSDPVYEQWEKLEPPTDKRNFEEKVRTVCNTYNQKKLRLLSRKIGAVKLELAKIDSKDRGAYQYRIFEACEEKLLEIIESSQENIDPKIIDTWIDELVKYADDHLSDKSKDFIYPFKNKDTLKNTILELFDSCFLSFDG